MRGPFTISFKSFNRKNTCPAQGLWQFLAVFPFTRLGVWHSGPVLRSCAQHVFFLLQILTELVKETNRAILSKFGVPEKKIIIVRNALISTHFYRDRTKSKNYKLKLNADYIWFRL